MSPDELLTGAKVFSLFVSVVSIVLSIYAIVTIQNVNKEMEGEDEEPPRVSKRMKDMGLVWKQDHTGEWYKAWKITKEGE